MFLNTILFRNKIKQKFLNYRKFQYAQNKMICGGFKEESAATAEVQTMVNNFKEQIQTQLSAVFSTFNAKTFTTQVVAGTNYKVKIEIDGGKLVEVKIFVPLPHTGNPHQLTSCNYV